MAKGSAISLAGSGDLRSYDFCWIRMVRSCAGTREQYQTVEDQSIVEVEYRVRHANAEWQWLHRRDTLFEHDGEGKPSQIFGTAQDITDHKRLEQGVLEIAAWVQRRIGVELHDGTGGTIVTCTLFRGICNE